MQYSQKNFIRIIGNDQNNNGQNFWEILERIIGKILSIIGAGLVFADFQSIVKALSMNALSNGSNSQQFQCKRLEANTGKVFLHLDEFQ